MTAGLFGDKACGWELLLLADKLDGPLTDGIAAETGPGLVDIDIGAPGLINLSVLGRPGRSSSGYGRGGRARATPPIGANPVCADDGKPVGKRASAAGGTNESPCCWQPGPPDSRRSP